MANQPQIMHTWPGVKLQACATECAENNTNGLEYEKLAIDDRTVRLRQLDPSKETGQHGAPLELPHNETALNMRLQHALSYYTSQNRTLRDGVVLRTATSHPAFDRRYIITGIGRAGDTSAMEVM